MHQAAGRLKPLIVVISKADFVQSILQFSLFSLNADLISEASFWIVVITFL
jgi:hypothetical protein